MRSYTRRQRLNTLLLVIVVLIAATVPTAQSGQAQTVLLQPSPLPTARQRQGPPTLPDFKLPYAEDAKVSWSGGPHSYSQGGNLTGTYPAGAGSGLDFANGTNFEVLAMADGVVEDVSCDNPGFGCQVAIRHDLGGTVLIYAHLLEDSTKIYMAKPGEPPVRVAQGDVIAKAGKSGGQIAVHLHIELRDGSDTCVTVPKANCLPNNLGGNPFGWDDGLPLVDGYVVFGYLVDSEGLKGYNYDGSAVRVVTETVKVVDDFPFLDYPDNIKRKGIARVHSAFQCNLKASTCEDNTQSSLTQFAGSGSFGGGGDILRKQSPLITAQSKASGTLISSNVPRYLDNSLLLALPTIPVLEPGKTIQVEIIVQNISQATWPANGSISFVNINKQTLGTQSPQQLLQAIPRGAPVKWILTIKAPATPGVYESIWQVASDGRPFGDRVRIAMVVVPKGSDVGLAEMLRAMIEDAQKQIADRFNAAWEDLKRRIEERIREEIQREVDRQLRGLCGVAPAGIVIAGGIVWSRRRRHQGRP
jgi:murein DD-endopeptidase MepM/ murein hydrolase activator NlpD